ncbi:MAG: cytochrome c [Gammaproteobacteria bacterium]|nr:cytochrome c [Gammaproteobacteria bacterium]MCI0591531.1 cytochrome c [Gammaproteobacteria bacterium]
MRSNAVVGYLMTLVVIVAVALAIMVNASEEKAAGETQASLKYVVECPEGAKSATQCKVDPATFTGYRMFNRLCNHCHGEDGVGSSFAPNMVDKFNQNVDYARFKDVVTHGFKGQNGVMPGFEKNQAVMDRLDQIYMYLKARADGVLGQGRPAQL